VSSVTVERNHTIVGCRDKQRSASLLAEILRLQISLPFARFLPLALANNVTLDYLEVGEPQPQHCAFVVDDDTFDAALTRIVTAGVGYHADPGVGRPGELYRRHEGRGVYFPDPDGHNMEIPTLQAVVSVP
jgi:catechol 2,3-dioxygenase-like lactoylglutathione lyase family enzyme